MTSNEIKSAFAAKGIKVRVKALHGARFRVCTIDGAPHTIASQAILAEIGCTDATGIFGGNVNQRHEIFTTAPGVIRRIAA